MCILTDDSLSLWERKWRMSEMRAWEKERREEEQQEQAWWSWASAHLRGWKRDDDDTANIGKKEREDEGGGKWWRDDVELILVIELFTRIVFHVSLSTLFSSKLRTVVPCQRNYCNWGQLRRGRRQEWMRREKRHRTLLTQHNEE